MSNIDFDVILASLKLARAMRRCPPERGEHPFPPAVGLYGGKPRCFFPGTV